MARIRTTFFFKSTRGYGWTETFYSTRTERGPALADAIALLPARVNLLGLNSFLPFIRVSDDEQKRDSKIFQVPEGDQYTKLPLFGESDIANTCLVVRVEATDFLRRTLPLRGIPDGLVVNSGQYVPTPLWNTALAVYAAGVAGGNFAIRGRVPVGVTFDILAVGTSGPTGIVTIGTILPHGFVAGDVVNITEVVNATEVRGLQKVLGVPSATTFDIRVSRVVHPYGGGGKVVKNGYALSVINRLLAVRASHRIAGRPFDSPVGRRSVR